MCIIIDPFHVTGLFLSPLSTERDVLINGVDKVLQNILLHWLSRQFSKCACKFFEVCMKLICSIIVQRNV